MAAETAELARPKWTRLHEAELKGAPLQPCPNCGHRDVKAYGQLLVCAVCEQVFWRPES